VKTLIQGGTVVTATETVTADVLIDDEKVAAIGTGLAAQPDRTIEATGRYVMPGAVDVHTHMDLPFGGSFCSDDFGTGTRAAAFGGTTTIVDFALQDYGETLRAGLDRWHGKARSSYIDYGFHMIVREVNDQVLKEMDTLVGEGVTSFKLFMAYPGVFMLDDAAIFQAMQRAADSGALIMMHAENGGPIDVLIRQYLAEGKTDPVNHSLTRPPVMEGEAVHRVFKMAELAGAPAYIVHLSSRDALDAVRDARDRGVSRGPSSCARPRCERRITKRNCGRVSCRMTSRSCRPTTRRSTSRDRRSSGRTISRRSRTACLRWRIGSRSCSRVSSTAGSA
jgi:dihydropyrimidinase